VDVVKFEKTRDYDTKSPEQLKEQLQDLERRIEKGLDDAEKRVLSRTVRINAATSPAVTHGIDELIVADTAAGSVTLLLPDPAKVPRRVLYAAKASTSNILIFQPISGTVNRTPTFGVTTRGLHAVMSDGVEYWVLNF